MKLMQTAGPTLGGQKPKGRKNTTLKPGKRRLSNTVSFTKIMKRNKLERRNKLETQKSK